MTCTLPLSPSPSHTLGLNAMLPGYSKPADPEISSRLHALPPPTRSLQEPHVHGLDRRTVIRPHRAADRGGHRRQLEVEMGPEKTIHDWRVRHCGFVPFDAGVHGGDCGDFCQDAGRCGS